MAYKSQGIGNDPQFTPMQRLYVGVTLCVAIIAYLAFVVGGLI